MAIPLIFLLLLSQLFAAFPEASASRILHLTHKGQVEEALVRYLEQVGFEEEQDYSLLQSMGQTLLLRGADDPDPEIRQLSLFGAGIAQSPLFIPILERGIKSKEMKSQLIALNFLSGYLDDSANSLLIEALNSPFLLTRLEACYQLALKHNPIVIDHLEALYYKVPPPVRILFPQIVVHIDTPEANRMLRHYLSDQDFLVRTQALLAIAKTKRDDFLEQVRSIAQHAHFVQQEAAAICLGEMRDRSSIKVLQKLATSRQDEVRLTALFSLQKLGNKEAIHILQEEAANYNLLAIAALAPCEDRDSKELLKRLSCSEDRNVAINASLALLQQKERACLPPLTDLLINDDIGFTPLPTPAGGLIAWKVTGSAKQKESQMMGLVARSEMMKQQILTACLELPEEDFLFLARRIFESQKKSLIPLLVQLLGNHRTENSVELLREMQQKAGAPFVRNYCNLALYKLGERGLFEEKLISWIQKNENSLLIQLKEEKKKDRETQFTLSAEESSKFFIEALEALLVRQSSKGVETLIHTIAYGNPKNRYALAGLLIRTTE
ncbi:MAG: hypothetical protein S4CHLAM81_10530 [Chlamydiales bacterium]|nr:hypothetical protein [Chlamydiales bacterium]MCH9635831.1 hypothetical protein [Chlamydiales bacterium]MCH9704147.1 HEAT repeat domain-containing protein [Chlamydiota bacterium]